MRPMFLLYVINIPGRTINEWCQNILVESNPHSDKNVNLPVYSEYVAVAKHENNALYARMFLHSPNTTFSPWGISFSPRPRSLLHATHSTFHL
jgi:hypothetical protein